MDYVHDALLKLFSRGIFAMVFAIIFILFGMEINILLHLCWFIGVFYLIDSITGVPVLNSPKFIEEKKGSDEKDNGRTEVQRQWDERDKDEK